MNMYDKHEHPGTISYLTAVCEAEADASARYCEAKTARRITDWTYAPQKQGPDKVSQLPPSRSQMTIVPVYRGNANGGRMSPAGG
jgi:hypothetical protein